MTRTAVADGRAAGLPPAQDVRDRRLRAAYWTAVVLLGAVQAWSARYAMNPDGVSYLDLADPYWTPGGLFGSNGYWSPLYPAILSTVLWLARWTSASEVVVVHAVNLALLLGAALAFDLLTGELVRRSPDGQPPRGALYTRAVAYASFLWTSLAQLNTALVTPDMLVALLCFAAAAVMLRAERRHSALLWGIWGATLGASYLAKAAMFPLAIVSLTVAGVVHWRTAHRARIVVAAIAFAVVTGPQLVRLSHQQGRLTFGSVGKIAYAWYISGVPGPMWDGTIWTGRPPGTGTPKHPVGVLSETPVAYSYASHAEGSFPLWYDPSFWYDGVSAPLRPTSLAYHTALNLWASLSLVLLPLLALIVLAMRSRIREAARHLRAPAPVLVPAVLAVGMYALVYTEPRYIAPFIALITSVLWSAFSRAPGRGFDWAAQPLAIVLSALLVLQTTAQVVSGALSGVSSTNDAWRTADAIRAAGVQPGARIALIGGPDVEYWARLARTQIIAQVPSAHAEAFWMLDGGARESLFGRFRSAGAQHVVAKSLPPWANKSGWKRIPNTGWHVIALR